MFEIESNPFIRNIFGKVAGNNLVLVSWDFFMWLTCERILQLRQMNAQLLWIRIQYAAEKKDKKEKKRERQKVIKNGRERERKDRDMQEEGTRKICD